MFQRGWFHIDVKRSDSLQQVLGVVRQYGPARVHPLCERTCDELAVEGRFAGLVIELSAASEPLLARLIERAPGLSVLALLPSGGHGIINTLQARGIATAVLPLEQPTIVSFVQRALTQNFIPSERVARLIAHLARTRGLTAREVQLLGYCLGDEPRARVRRRLGITENTLKTQIRGLLRKCGERNLDALAKNVLRSALAVPTHPIPPEVGGEITRPLTLAHG